MKLPGLIQFRKCTLSDKQLAESVAAGLGKMYSEPFRVPSRSIPARPEEDFDLLVGELIVRFIELLEKHPQTIEDHEAVTSEIK